MRLLAICLGGFLCLISFAVAETRFIEAESWQLVDGWKVADNPQTRGASFTKCLNGATGDSRGRALSEPIQMGARQLRVWVRYSHHSRIRGAFQVGAYDSNETLLAEKLFGIEPQPGVADWAYVWEYFDITTTGDFQLQLSKHENKNCSGYVRNIDCFLITDDKELVPDHRPYGPQTWMRVTLGDIYSKPLHVHIFADHYRSPWYSHWYVCKDGVHAGLQPKDKSVLLNANDQTPWCNITAMLHEDSGAILNITARHAYQDFAERLKAKVEFATEANEQSVVRSFDINSTANGEVILVPAHLQTKAMRQWLKSSREVAEKTGRFADQFDWPTIGKKPTKISFFAAFRPGGYNTPVDQSIEDREWKTLDYFGFSNREKYRLHGHIWRMKNRSYCDPDLEYMRKNAKLRFEKFKAEGKSTDKVAYCFLTDEPQGQALSLMEKDAAYRVKFRQWIRDRLGKQPSDLLVDTWEDVVPSSDRDAKPGLYYYSQMFRTRALGDFMVTQRKMIEEAYQATFPFAVNFSDGPIYTANFYTQGVDYFELLDDDNQNGIWGEDWANGASSYQCAAYNVDLMRSAARERGQMIGHYLIAYAGRKSWDIKTKAAGETARGVRVWHSFSYGPSWGSHEGGPLWRNHAWYSKPDVWKASAEVVREIGAVEDRLLKAKQDPADVAIVYNNSSDIWTVGKNYAFGFERMHTWMALAHAQVPVDIVAERQIEKGALQGKKVCYLSGPNLTRKAAEKIRDWVIAGGVLVVTAGAAEFDEFNRPMDILSKLLPATREVLQTGQPFLNSGSYVYRLRALDSVNQDEMEVLSVKQAQVVKAEGTVISSFSDGSPSAIRGSVGRGAVYSYGFLPALCYIKKAVVARRSLLENSNNEPSVPPSNHPAPPVELSEKMVVKNSGDPRLGRSYNPWDFSKSIRDAILAPVRAAKVDPPLICDTPLIDAIVLKAPEGMVIPLANHTLEEQKSVQFRVRVGKQVVNRVESVHHGRLAFQQTEDLVTFALPLAASDYILIDF